MKKILQNVGMRILSCLLCTICVLVLGVAAVASVFYAERQNETETYKEGATKIADSYALYALERTVDVEATEELTEFLSQNGIRCKITLVEKEGKKTTELYNNLEEGAVQSYQTEIIKGTDYRYIADSLWGALGNCHYYMPGEDWIYLRIDGYIFDVEAGVFYYKTSVGYFPVENLYVHYKDDTPSCDYELKTIEGKKCYYNGYYNTKLDMSQYESWSSVRLNEYDVELEYSDQIEFITDSSTISGRIHDIEASFDMDNLNVNIGCHYEGPVDTYVIQIDRMNLTEDNLFEQWEETCCFIYVFQNHMVIIVVVFFLLFILGFLVMIFSTIEEKEKLGYLHKVPIAIYSGSIFFIEVTMFFLIEQGILSWIYYNSIQLDVAYSLLVIVVFVMVLLAFMYLQNLITRIRTRSLLRYSELHYAGKILKGMWNVFANITIRPIKRFRNAIRENTALFTKGIGILILISLIEFFMLALCVHHPGAMLLGFLAGKCIEIPLVLMVLVQMDRLREGAERIASGDLHTPIDTSKMFWEFKKHGENINNVSQSIQLAVEKQMKSERFKTELITNVSHDIKTPLTSIINYVDLIKKEDITDEKLCEYVEVLDRQSARLKKLIEDLMEASKASTGNLAVHMEECDVEVLLTQIIGEFEERLQTNQLEVVVSKPEHPVKIQADGRHMWRVLDNLLGNACKYAMPNTRVYVSLEQQGKEAVVVFKNISKVALNIPSEELMERFVRGDSSRNTEGSGLGLSIAQSLTELMHGTMKLDIDGDLFKVTLRFPL